MLDFGNQSKQSDNADGWLLNKTLTIELTSLQHKWSWAHAHQHSIYRTLKNILESTWETVTCCNRPSSSPPPTDIAGDVKLLQQKPVENKNLHQQLHETHQYCSSSWAGAMRLSGLFLSNFCIRRDTFLLARWNSAKEMVHFLSTVPVLFVLSLIALGAFSDQACWLQSTSNENSWPIFPGVLRPLLLKATEVPLPDATGQNHSDHQNTKPTNPRKKKKKKRHTVKGSSK